MEGTSLDEWNEATAKPVDLVQMDEYVKKLVGIKEEYDRAKAVLDEVSERLESAKLFLIETLKAANKKSYKVDGVALLTVTQTPSVKVPAGLMEKVQFFEYLKSKSEEAFLGLVSVNSKTLNSWYKQEFDAFAEQGKVGFKIPGLEEPSVRESLSIRKDNKK